MAINIVLEKYAKMTYRYPYIIAFIFIVISIAFFMKAKTMTIESDITKFINQEIDVIKAQKIMENRFGNPDMVILLIERDITADTKNAIKDMREIDVLRFEERLEDQLSDMKEFVSFDYAAKNIRRKIRRLPESYEESIYLHDRLSGLRRYYNRDFSSTAFYGFGRINLDSKKLEKFEEEINKRIKYAVPPAGIKVRITGRPSMLKAMVYVLVGSMKETTSYSFILVLILLYLYFRGFIIALLPLIPILFAVIWSSGSMRILDIPLSTITAGVSAMLIGIGIDYGIHVVHRYLEERESGKDIRNSLGATYGKLGFAILVTALTTVSGFTGLLTASMPGIQQLGEVMALGVFYCMIGSLFFLPVLLVIGEKKGYLKNLGSLRTTYFDKYFEKIGYFVEGNIYTVLISLAILTIFFGYGIRYVDIETDMSKDMPEHLDVVSVMNRYHREFGASDYIFVLFEKNDESPAPKSLLNNHDIKEIHRFAELIKTEKYVDHVLEPIDILPNRKFPADEKEYKKYLRKGLDKYVSGDQELILIKIGTGVSDDTEKIAELMETIKEDISYLRLPSYITVKYAGAPVIRYELRGIIKKEMKSTTLYGFIFVLTIVFITYRSIALTLTALMPLILSIIWTYGIMGYLGMSISTNTSSIFSMILGLGIDFAIHLNHRFKELVPHMTMADAMAETYKSVGAAITLTTATTIAGFFAMTIGDNPFMDRLGIMLSIGVFSCLIVSLMIIPPAIIIENRIIKYIKRKSRFTTYLHYIII